MPSKKSECLGRILTAVKCVCVCVYIYKNAEANIYKYKIFLAGNISKSFCLKLVVLFLNNYRFIESNRGSAEKDPAALCQFPSKVLHNCSSI